MTEHVERELLIPAPPDEVWEVVTTDGWLADEVALELSPGGDAHFAGPDCERAGWVEEAVAPDDGSGRLVFWWSRDDEPASRVELTLEPEAGIDPGAPASTRVRVLETRPLEVLDVVGIPLPGAADANRGPMLLAA
jgi:uncharacterized protein YndB with AHSA1/START domain